MDLSTQPLSVKVTNTMVITTYPQLIQIEQDGVRWRYIGYSITEAKRLFKKQIKHVKHDKYKRSIRSGLKKSC
jgi:hypothetical protein